MERDDKVCPYLKGGADGAVCRLLDCSVREIRFTDTGVCLRDHAACQVYRRYGDDYIKA